MKPESKALVIGGKKVSRSWLGEEEKKKTFTGFLLLGFLVSDAGVSSLIILRYKVSRTRVGKFFSFCFHCAEVTRKRQQQ
jgi:hypothetical protein